MCIFAKQAVVARFAWPVIFDASDKYFLTHMKKPVCHAVKQQE